MENQIPNQHKTFCFISLFLAAVVSFGSLRAAETVRVIKIITKKMPDNALHWVPETGKNIVVTQGEKVHFSVSLKQPGGFDVHGFNVPDLNINDKQVTRKAPLEVDATVPMKLTPGEYKIGCQLHSPNHKPAILIVKAATAKTGATD